MSFDHEIYEAKDRVPRDSSELGPVGERAVRRICRFFRRVYRGYEIRYTRPALAPSIISRSDAEFHDVSYPRWACRYHLKLVDGPQKHYVGFVNVRRLEVLRLAIRDRKGAGLPPATPPMADALLRYPPRQREEWLAQEREGRVELCLLETDLGPEYGELSFPGALPYVKPDAAWGGVCAHGCLVMAALLMRRFGARVYGLSDIAAILKIPRVSEGLSLLEDQRFFCDRRVGTNSFVEYHYRPDANAGRQHIAASLCGYLRSRLPVLVSVDAVKARLMRPDGGKDHTHAVLLVGFLRNRYSGKLDFVFQDTLTRPFRTIAFDRLLAGRAGKAFRFLVPVPASVRMPLGPYLTLDGDKPITKAGLLLHTQLLFKKTPPTAMTDWLSERPSFGVDVDATSLIHVLVSREELLHRYITLNDGRHARMSQAFAKSPTFLPDWLWIQEKRNADNCIRGIWCWDATRARPAGDPLFVVGCDEQSFVRFKASRVRTEPGKLPPRMKSGRDCLVKPEHPPLRASLLSSYAPNLQLKRLLQETGEHSVDALDLYCFTHIHLRELSPLTHLTGQGDPLAVEDQLAAWCRTSQSDRCETAADNIFQAYERAAEASGRRPCIPALASYMPRISDTDSTVRKTSVDAIRGLVRIARHLRAPERLGPAGPSVIEIVAGNVWTGRADFVESKDGQKRCERTLAWCDPETKTLKLLEALKEVIDAEGLNDERLGVIVLAIELEPGALSLVQDMDSLARLAEALNKEPAQFACVGFNVDVGHYRLAGAQPDDVRSRRHVFERMAHAHISDFGAGHLADLVPGVMTGSEQFDAWIGLLAEAARLPHAYRRANNLPSFSGFVAAEMEACRHPSQAFSAYHRTRLMIDHQGRS